MEAIQEKLAEANKKIDLRIDDIWTQAEKNLKQLEEEFYRRKREDEKS